MTLGQTQQISKTIPATSNADVLDGNGWVLCYDSIASGDSKFSIFPIHEIITCRTQQATGTGPLVPPPRDGSGRIANENDVICLLQANREQLWARRPTLRNADGSIVTGLGGNVTPDGILVLG